MKIARAWRDDQPVWFGAAWRCRSSACETQAPHLAAEEEDRSDIGFHHHDASNLAEAGRERRFFVGHAYRHHLVMRAKARSLGL
jgi:hypothetical protein